MPVEGSVAASWLPCIDALPAAARPFLPINSRTDDSCSRNLSHCNTHGTGRDTGRTGQDVDKKINTLLDEIVYE